MTEDNRYCTCGELITIEARVCPKCGRKNHQLGEDPESVDIKGYPPAIIIEGKDSLTDEDRIKVESPGARSESRERQSGDHSFAVEGSEAGRKSEPWTLKLLLNNFRRLGHDVDVLDPIDAHGEDALYQIGGNTYVIQVTTVPPDSKFWQAACQSRKEEESSIERAIRWFRQAVENKADTIPDALRRQTILVLDVRHVGTLATGNIVTEYLSKFLCPSSEFGFASVWVVGPTRNRCIRLGDGYP